MKIRWLTIALAVALLLGGAANPSKAAECVTATDDCFAALEAHRLETLGSVGAGFRPLQDGEPGLEVWTVVEGGPAERAGLREGDLLIAIDGEELAQDATGWQRLVGFHQVLEKGQEVGYTVVRAGRELTLSMVAGSRSAEAMAHWLALELLWRDGPERYKAYRGFVERTRGASFAQRVFRTTIAGIGG